MCTNKIIAQDNPIIITNQYHKKPFIEFAQDIEANTQAKLFFKKTWVDSILVTSSSAGVSLEKTLQDVLSAHNLQLYIDDQNNYYIYPGQPLTNRLPDYKQEFIQSDETDSPKDTITEAEKRYLEGQMIAATEVIPVGDKNQTTPGRKYVVDGMVRDKSSGEPLIGATVYVPDMEIGAATDMDGQFKLVLPPGKHKTVFNFMSMKAQEYYLQVYSSGSVTINMEQELIKINEVQVSANKFDNVKGMQMGFERVSAKTMKEIPVVMGEKDLLKVAQLLPGVQNVGEGTSGFNVRGGSADQNMFYINQIPIYNTSHLFGFFTAFSPDVVNDFSLYKSNIPARYGGRLSSIFDISTRQGNKNEFFTKGGISPITGHVMAEGPIIKEKSSFVTSWRSTYSDWLLNQINNNDIQNSSAFFYDATFGVNTQINDNNILKVFGYRSADEFELASKNDYQYANTGGSVRWKHSFSSSLTGNFAVVYSQYEFKNTDKNSISESYTHEYYLKHHEIKADFLKVTPTNHYIEFGASSIYYDLNRGDISPYGEESLRKNTQLGMEKGVESALYISDEFDIMPGLTFKGGLRYSFFTLLGPKNINEYIADGPRNQNNVLETREFDSGEIVKFHSGPEFRGALKYTSGENSSVKFSYNRLRQYIFMLSNTIALSPNDQWKLADYHIEPPVNDQISLGYYKDFPDIGVSSSIEVYQKWIQNVVEYKDGADFLSEQPIETQVLQGEQDSRGLELMLKKNTGKFTGWFSYTFSRSFVQVDSDYEENRINNGLVYPSNYDRPHSLNFYSNLRSNRRLSLSTNIVYSTGRPITYPVSVYYSEGQQFIHYSERNEYRIPDYFRIDLSINLEGNLVSDKLAHSYWMLNIYNLTGRDNAYSIYYEAEDGQIQGYKLSVFAQPIVTLSWNFKFGNYRNE